MLPSSAVALQSPQCSRALASSPPNARNTSRRLRNAPWKRRNSSSSMIVPDVLAAGGGGERGQTSSSSRKAKMSSFSSSSSPKVSPLEHPRNLQRTRCVTFLPTSWESFLTTITRSSVAATRTMSPGFTCASSMAAMGVQCPLGPLERCAKGGTRSPLQLEQRKEVQTGATTRRDPRPPGRICTQPCVSTGWPAVEGRMCGNGGTPGSKGCGGITGTMSGSGTGCGAVSESESAAVGVEPASVPPVMPTRAATLATLLTRNHKLPSASRTSRKDVKSAPGASACPV
mmetsp:Transcript_7822/g.19333  ORF Transcript_7822/g.19333 Transcript_7822/m.19333 type:complete len:286 (-) Transcript_7822:1377-2234(-)